MARTPGGAGATTAGGGHTPAQATDQASGGGIVAAVRRCRARSTGAGRSLRRWPTARSRCGTTRSRTATISPPAPPCPATARPTWPSSAPASPGSGRRSTCGGSTRRCGSRWSRPRSRASGPAAATGAGARRSCPWGCRSMAGSAGRDAAIAMQQAMFATVDEVGRAAAEEGIDCHYAKGGYLHLATNPAHTGRLREELEEARRFDLGEDDLRWLDRAEAADRLARGRRPRRALHAPLRGDPPGPTGTGSGDRGGAPRRRPPRGHPGDGHRTRAGAHRPGHRHGRRRRPGHRGLHPARSTVSAGRWCRCTPS